MNSQAEKPAVVSSAIGLLYLTLIMGIVRTLLEWPHLEQHLAQLATPDFPFSVHSFALFLLVCGLGIMWWLIHKMDHGRNWSRVLFGLFFLVGLPFAVQPLLQSLSDVPLSGLLGVVQIGLQTLALLLVFCPQARPWFHPDSEPSSGFGFVFLVCLLLGGFAFLLFYMRPVGITASIAAPASTASQRETTLEQPVLTQSSTSPPPQALPSGRTVNDQYKSLAAGAEVFNDVTVKMVFPDSISIIHRDGATTIPFANVSQEIQNKYNYDFSYAQAYIALKAAHTEYKKNKIKQAEKKNNIESFDGHKPTHIHSADTSSSVQPKVISISGTLQMLISKGNESVARTEYEKYLRTADRLEVRGTVLRHLQRGNLLVKGSVGYPKTRGMKYYQTYLLFGLPEADRLADGDTFDAFAVMGDVIETADRSRIREYIYVDEVGRRPSRFPPNTGMYD